jgi:hypothetical protein
MDFPEVAGKTVEAIALHDDPLYGREVTIQFDDRTELSISIASEQIAYARYFLRDKDQTITEHKDQEAPAPVVQV